MSKVLLLTLVFAPDGVSTALLLTDLAQELSSLGHEVTVLTTTPHYNNDVEARARQPLNKRFGGLLYESELNGIKVWHASMPTKGDRVGARLLDYLRFHAISTIAGLFISGKCDVILAPSPPLTIGLSAWILRIFKRAPFIYNVQEIYPDVAVSLGMLTNQRVIHILEWLERFIYKRSKAITVISERFKQRLLAKGVEANKLEIIPNFVDTDFIQPGERKTAFSTRHGLDDKFVILYAGNIGLTQSFETILAATKLVRGVDEVHFLVVGDGTRRAWLEEQLAEEDYPNVTLLPYQPRSSVPEMYASVDICLVPLKRGTAQETFPSKIYTIMAAKRAVIASADPESELADVVQHADCGWTAIPDDPQSLAAAILEAEKDRDVVNQRAENGYQYVIENHSRQAIAKQYDVLIKKLAR